MARLRGLEQARIGRVDIEVLQWRREQGGNGGKEGRERLRRMNGERDGGEGGKNVGVLVR